MSPEDLVRFGLVEGERVRVVSRRGQVEVPVRRDESLRPGLVFMTFHFQDDVAVNLLTIDATASAKSGDGRVQRRPAASRDADESPRDERRCPGSPAAGPRAAPVRCRMRRWRSSHAEHLIRGPQLPTRGPRSGTMACGAAQATKPGTIASTLHAAAMRDGASRGRPASRQAVRLLNRSRRQKGST